MTCVSADIERFRRAIGRRLGLHCDNTKDDALSDLLENRIVATGSTPATYLSELESGQGAGEELRALSERLTVNETYFFRNIEQLKAFEEIALPTRMRARMDRSPLRVLSAGCASGEEPFTLSILAQSCLAGAAGRRVELTGVDVDRSALSRARLARY